MKRRILLTLSLMTMAVTMVLTLVLATPAQATQYFNCPNGVACIWKDVNGGGTVQVISAGTFGYNLCHPLNPAHPLYDAGSSASADFGGGWDLVVYDNTSCSSTTIFNRQDVQSSRFENWGGNYFNDQSRAFMIRMA